jgi:hypothetical protein
MGGFLAYFPYFEKIEVGLSDHHVLCVSVCPYAVSLSSHALYSSTLKMEAVYLSEKLENCTTQRVMAEGSNLCCHNGNNLKTKKECNINI